VFTDTIACEADIVPPLVHRCSLATPPHAWAEALLAMRASGPPISRAEAFAVAEATPFNVHTSWKLLERVYAHR
jgi:hypothetical protein